MFRFLVALFALAAMCLPSMAFDASNAIRAWEQAHYFCRMGETKQGEKLEESVVSAECVKRETLSKELLENGYCFDTSEQEWTVCLQLGRLLGTAPLALV